MCCSLSVFSEDMKECFNGGIHRFGGSPISLFALVDHPALGLKFSEQAFDSGSLPKPDSICNLDPENNINIAPS